MQSKMKSYTEIKRNSLQGYQNNAYTLKYRTNNSTEAQ